MSSFQNGDRRLTSRTGRILVVLVLVSVSLFLFVSWGGVQPEGGYRRAIAERLYRLGNSGPSFFEWQSDRELGHALRLRGFEAAFPTDLEFDFVVQFDGIRYRGNRNNIIDLHVLLHGAWEKSVFYFLRDAMVGIGEPEGIFVDVGANTGQHSLLMSKYSQEVHAFEPYQPVLARFQEMIADNNLDNIRVHPFGLGNEQATLPFFEPPESNQGTGSFIEGFKNDNQSNGGLQLEIRIGDEEFQRLEVPRVDLIKMDIEGYEKLALLGLKETIRVFRPIIVVEMSVDPALEATFKDEVELLNVFPERYELRRLISESNALGHYSLHEFEPDFGEVRQYNLVVYPMEKSEYLKQTNH